MPREEFLDVPRSRFQPPAPTRAACEAAGLLGVTLDDLHRELAQTALRVPWIAGAVVLVTGPSGSGKSTLLRDIADAAERLGHEAVCAAEIDLPDRPVLELMGAGKGGTTWRVRGAMRALASAGLGEAGVFVRRPRELSDGQRARLRLAMAMRRCPPGGVLIADEFASGLDALTARALACAVRRFAGHRGARVVLASSRDDAPALVGPCPVVRLEPDGAAAVEHGAPAGGPGPGVEIGPGTIADFDRLARWHYRAARPATFDARGIRRAVDTASGQTVGVLVPSLPTLNGAWRTAAWGEGFAPGDKRRLARRLNAEVRCISRVVVDPRARGLGVATALVRAYLAAPLTPRTEAVAAMGRVSGFFARAGMRELRGARPARDLRLLAALRGAGVERWRLAQPGAVRARLESCDEAAREEVRRALRAWASAGRRGAASADPLLLACRVLPAERSVYVRP
ncbi:MAG: hypothetical protein IBJ11_10945 [Phycisphaerales bacterium]|nr:hypothetical protein [Phycisphaerales bacterium]